MYRTFFTYTCKLTYFCKYLQGIPNDFVRFLIVGLPAVKKMKIYGTISRRNQLKMQNLFFRTSLVPAPPNTPDSALQHHVGAGDATESAGTACELPDLQVWSVLPWEEIYWWLRRWPHSRCTRWVVSLRFQGDRAFRRCGIEEKNKRSTPVDN